MARSDSASLLQLPRDGWARNDIYRRDGLGGAALLARKTIRIPMDALDADDLCAFALHREHRGLDDGGAGTPALVDLRIDAHGSGGFPTRRGGQCLVHADWLHGHVRGAGNPMAVPDLS